MNDLKGRVFGRLTVLRRNGSTKKGGAIWLCSCTCGATKSVPAAYLLIGDTRSCGCLAAETKATMHITHGMSKTKEHVKWLSMLQRCRDPKASNYKNYGGRGISVCKRWQKFENFFADMGFVLKGSTIERIDKDKNYCKENCRWASNKEQARNKRNNRVITANGKTLCVSEWAEITGISINTLWKRLVNGWGDVATVTVPPSHKRSKKEIKKLNPSAFRGKGVVAV